MIVDIVIRVDLDIEGQVASPQVQEALSNLADVMCVQAEDGLYTLGSPDAIMDGKENEHIADIRTCTVESLNRVPVPLFPGPDPLLEFALHAASPDTLLKAFAMLTHQMHAARPAVTAQKRAERDQIAAEITRRMAD